MNFDTDTLLVAGLAMIAAGGIFYAFVYPYLSGDARAEKRQAALQQSGVPIKRGIDRNQEVAQRRKQITESLKELEAKGKAKKVSLEARIRQAGLTWTPMMFFVISGAIGVGVAAIVFFVSGEALYALGGLFIGALGVPRWLLSHLKKRRLKKFTVEFPNSVDVIIRGIKAGLPLGDCLRIIASEGQEPVRSEFRQIIESTTMGLTISESVERLVERVPTPEASFFAIVISIQQKAGGNLSEALTNLSRVLRDRKKMQLKVKAMSSEAKASAGIIGSLPFFVGGLVYLSSPRYIELLWITSTGRMVLLVSGFWMLIGILSMKKMINFNM
jgi:tight adherence protein B